MPSIRVPFLRFLLHMVVGISLAAAATANAGEELVLVVPDGTDIPVHVHAAEPGPVLLWFPSEHGLLPGHHQQARQLQQIGVETWLPDPFTGYFLPTAPSSFDRFPSEIVSLMIQEASHNGERPVFVFGNDRAVPWLLEGLRGWQLTHPGADYLAGLILMSPYLHTGLPEVGEAADFHPIARAINLPIYLIQPRLSPQYPLLQRVHSLLSEGGSDVAVRTLPDVRDRFFFRPNTLDAEEALKPRFTGEILQAMRLLARLPSVREPVRATDADEQLRLATPTRQDRQLEPVYARPAAPPLRLPDLQGEVHDLSDYTDEVVLINFWASWCPPCVHEMPSMQRLENRLHEQGFRILAVNLGETQEKIQSFVERIGTDFIILMDPRSESLDHWRALAYPSSYIVDRRGQLRYSLFGAIEWNEPDVVARIAALLDE